MHQSDFSVGYLPGPLRDLFLLWRGAEDRIPPRLSTLVFHHLTVTVDALALTEIQRGSDGRPYDLRLLYTSSGVRPKIEDDFRGKLFSEVPGKGPGSAIWAAYMAVARSGRPHRVTLPYVGPLARIEDTTELYLPLCDDTGMLSFIMAGIVLNEATQTMPPRSFDSGETIPPSPRAY